MFSWFANPHRFLTLSSWLAPIFYGIAALLIGWGLWQGLWIVPEDDYQGGDIMRVMFVHVPAAWLAMASYLGMAVMSFVWFIWRHEVADIAAKAIAPLGATWTALCLATGAIWGKPTWGTYWEWDARLTSMLILLFLYFGIIALRMAISNRDTAAKATSVMAIVGVINIPIIKYSVDWWNTLHQPATFTITEKPAMPPEMWLPLLVMVLAFYGLFTLNLFMRMRLEILKREHKTRWVRDALENNS